jgi:hypothetical protein
MSALSPPIGSFPFWEVGVFFSFDRSCIGILVSCKEHEDGMDKLPKDPAAVTYPNDRRKSVRYPITVEVKFKWQAEDGHWHHATGITRDIGIAGLFVESESVSSVDSVVKLTVILPATSKFKTALHLGGIAVVRHVQQKSSQGSGFGAVANFQRARPMSSVSKREER